MGITESGVDSWTDSLTRCEISGVGYAPNAKYSTRESRQDHEYLHETLNLDVNGVRLYGLFCGYNGDKRVAKFIANRLTYELYNDTPIASGMAQESVTKELERKFDIVVKAYDTELSDLFVKRMVEKESEDESNNVTISEINQKLRAAATALVVLFLDNNIYVLNCGNSRAVAIVEKNGDISPEPLNFEHDADNEEEAKRIRALGIDPSLVHRPTRALGDCFRQMNYLEDKDLKDATSAPVVSTPEIMVYPWDPSYKYLILFSDSMPTALEENGVDPSQVNRAMMTRIQREVTYNNTSSATSVAQAVVDSLLREHRERFLSGDAAGKYNRHEDMSLLLAAFKPAASNDGSTNRFTIDTNSLSIEDTTSTAGGEETEKNEPVPNYVDLDGFDDHHLKDEIMQKLMKIFNDDVAMPLGHLVIQEEDEEQDQQF